MKNTLIPKNRLEKSRSEMLVPKIFPRTKESADILMEASRLWSGLDRFRRDARRYREYTFGNQWGDKILNPNATSEEDKYITEGQHIMNQGKVPLKNNMIRQIVKTVVGQFAGTKTEPFVVASDRDDQKLSEMMSIMMKYSYNLNKLWDLDRRTLEKYLICGVICNRITYGWNEHLQKMDAFVYPINHNNLFFDNVMSDPRMWDCSVIGTISDMTIEDVISSFGCGDKEKIRQLRNIYNTATKEVIRASIEGLTSESVNNIDFLTTDYNLCRVIEVWRRESKERYRCHDKRYGEWYKIDGKDLAKVERENKDRIRQYTDSGYKLSDVPLIETELFMDSCWIGRWLAPTGEVLKEMETPYWHKSHPFVLSIYPFYDSEVHSFVEDIIDQQRYINRLITLLDFIMGASAKGVLLLPEDQIPDGVSIDDISEQWHKYNGVIMYKPKAGYPVPQQVSANSTNIGAYEMLNMQMQLMKEISGVHAAMQGQQAKSGTAASLYAQEAQNSANNLIDLLVSYNTFREERDTKLMQIIQQYTTDKRYIGIAGKGYEKEARYFDPEKVRNAQFELSILESESNATVRQIQNNILMRLFEMQAIDVRQLLENGAFPFADRLLRSIDKREKQMQQMQQQQIAAAQAQQGAAPQEQEQENPIPDDIMQAVYGGSNPMFNQMMQR